MGPRLYAMIVINLIALSGYGIAIGFHHLLEAPVVEFCAEHACWRSR
jgi:hypothetical protein